jgi:ferric-dicitrate binding protein FerR (iron transport regulator)
VSTRPPGPGSDAGSGPSGFDVEIERALACVPRPAAAAEFKARLRSRFLDVDPDLRAEASLGPAAHSSEARARGPMAGGAGGAGGARADDVWRRRFVSLSVIAAAAAVLLALFVLRPRGPRWQVLDGTGAGIAKIDGSPVDTSNRVALADALAGATTLESGTGLLRLRLGDLYLLELDPHSRVALSALDKHSRAEPLSLRAERGALRVQTGPAFPGSSMRVSTSELDLRVTGTAFAVDLLDSATEQGTCVCCLEGSVEVRSASKIPDARAISAGAMCVVFRDKKAPPLWGEVVEPHARPLRALEEVARTIWPAR